MIRPAQASDAAAIASIWNPIIRDTAITFTSTEKSEADVATMIQTRTDAGHAFLVADHRGQIAGFCSYAQFRAGPGYAHSMEHSILLAPAARGLGLGSTLLRAVEDHARAKGAHVMMAGVSAENPAGHDFHAAQGYGTLARLPEVGFKFGRWIDLLLMQKILT